MGLGRHQIDRRVGDERDPSRVVAPHRVRHRLPPNRAVVGGVLIAAAATGVLVAHRSASSPPTTRYVVLTSPVPAGTALEQDDLGTIAIDLPGEVGAVAADDAEDMIGRVTRTGLAEFDLLRPDDVHEAGRFADPESVEVAVDLSPAQALIGTIEVGNTVNVLSTDPSGSGTETIVEGVRVSGIDGGDTDSAIGASGSVRVRLAVADAAAAEAVVDAAVRAEMTLALPAPVAGDDT